MAWACRLRPGWVADVVQEVWLAVLRFLPRIAAAGRRTRLRGWLFRVTQRKAADAYRAARRQPGSLQVAVAAGNEPSSRHLSPGDDLDRQFRSQRLHAALDTLRQEKGVLNVRILEMRIVEGQTLKQVAAALGLSRKTVCRRQQQGLAQLRRILSRCGVKGLREDGAGGPG
jgi:RNA polymerase sigma factor (sigma-70 family)